MRPKLAGLLFLVAGVLVAPAAPALAAPPSCGDVLTHSVRLRADLVCAPADTGLVIGADGVTVNLDGHAIRGAHLAVDATGGFDDVAVRDGRLLGNQLGIRLAGVSDGRLAHLTISGGLEGVSATGGDNLHVRDVDSCATFTPISLSGESDGAVRLSRACGGSNGLTVGLSQRIKVVGNRFVDNERAGVRLNGTSDSIVRENVARGNRRVGISIAPGSGNLVARNLAVRNTSGIEVESGAVGTLVRDNIASFNDLEPPLAPFARDGIGVYDASTVVRGNLASFNAGYGIFAPAGAVDAGGNHAFGNAGGQCLNVGC